MKISNQCIQVRLLEWQCNRVVRLVDQHGVARFVRIVSAITWASTFIAAFLAVCLMAWVLGYVSATTPAMSLWALLAGLFLSVAVCWAWSGAWGLGMLHYDTREKWCNAYNDPHQPGKGEHYSPRRVWQLRVLTLLLDQASVSALRSRALSRATTAPSAGTAASSHARPPARF